MKKSYLASAAVLFACLTQAPAQAARAPSLHVRCDGNPDNVTAGETAARLLGAVTLLGVFAPPPETPNSTARLSGNEGIAICDQALSSESNDIRRAQLILARALHRIEAGNYQAAIDDARSVSGDRPAFSATVPYQLSFRLSALEVEALALAASGRTREAADKAMEMAAAAPYDITASMRASRYVSLTGQFGEPERAFYERYVRLYPVAVAERAHARMFAGDYRAAGEDFLLFNRIAQSSLGEEVPGSLANAAVAQALAGQTELADRTAAHAQELIAAAAEKAAGTNLAPTREILDFFRILRMAQSGRSADARLLFAARSGWTSVGASTVSALARTLREGAEPAQLTGLLEGDPARFRNDALAARLTNVREGNGSKERFSAIRPYSTPANFTAFSDNVWKTEGSRYFERNVDQETRSRFVTTVRNGGGAPSGYALLLHSALVARAEGKTSFMVLPVQSALYAARVRTGNESDDTIIAPVSFNAAQVIQDLSPLFPQAESRRRR